MKKLKEHSSLIKRTGYSLASMQKLCNIHRSTDEVQFQMHDEQRLFRQKGGSSRKSICSNSRVKWHLLASMLYVTIKEPLKIAIVTIPQYYKARKGTWRRIWTVITRHQQDTMWHFKSLIVSFYAILDHYENSNFSISHSPCIRKIKSPFEHHQCYETNKYFGNSTYCHSWPVYFAVTCIQNHGK